MSYKYWEEAQKTWSRREATDARKGSIEAVAANMCGGPEQLQDMVDKGQVRKVVRGRINYFVFPELSCSKTHGFDQSHEIIGDLELEGGQYESIAASMSENQQMGMDETLADNDFSLGDSAELTGAAAAPSGPPEFLKPSKTVLDAISEASVEIMAIAKETFA